MEATDERPWSEETEVSVLGAMLIDDEANAEALERLKPEDFYREANRRIFDAFRRLRERGEAAADVALLSDELKASGDLEAVGGMPYLAKLVDAVPSAANLESYVRVLRRHRARREAVEAVRRVEGDLSDGGPVEEALEAAQERLREARKVLSEDGRDSPRTIREILENPDFGESPAVVADRLAWAGRTSLLAAREKSGKSSVIRYAVARRSRGERVWGGVPVGGPLTTLWYGEEHRDDVAAEFRRLGADLDRIHYRDMRTIPGDRLASLARDVDRIEPQLVIVDTLPRLAAPREPEPGSSKDWEPILGELGALAADSDAAFILNHHANKADGSYRDSTAIGAGVDVILEMRRSADGEASRRDVKAYPRAGIRVRDFSYVMVGTEDDPRFDLVDDTLPLKDRVRRFVERDPPHTQTAILDGVEGRTEEIREKLQGLVEAGTVEKEEKGRSFQYRPSENPEGNGPETVGKRFGNESTGNGGATVSENPPLSVKQRGGSETEAEPVGEEP